MTTMKRGLVVLVAVLAIAWAAFAQGGSAVGTWNCTATDQTHAQWPWTLVISSSSGTLSGTATGHAGTFPLSNVNFDGTNLTFSVSSSDQSYSAQLKVAGTSMTGTYSGSSSGTVTGSLQQ
jgi:hypothetical protein